MKVLIIDDEQMILSLAERILKREGYEVITADSGGAGIEVFKNQSDTIDCLLLDLTLDDMHGFDVLREVRSIKPSIACIISSGQGIEGIDFPAELRKRTTFLEKPYRSKQLTAMIEELLAVSS